MIFLTSLAILTVLILIFVKKYLDKKEHPKGLFYLFFAEMWERFSFYGMRALLVLYLIKSYMEDLENNEEIAFGIFASYGALVYLTPMIGGYIADKFLGYRKAIIFGGILMALGHFAMAFENDIFFYGALGLLIIGNGFFKPNISGLVGSLYTDGDEKRDAGFTVFYMGINLGAMIAPLFCGYLGEEYGWHYGFGAAGIGMLAGLVVFWKGIQNNALEDKGLQPAKYINKKISGIKVDNIIYTLGFLSVPIFAYIILLNTQSEALKDILIPLLFLIIGYMSYLIYDLKVRKKNKQDGNRLIAVMILCAFLTVFWACFEMSGSAITVWADKCVNLFGLNASQTNSLNPGYIVILAIPFSWMWTKLDIANKNPNTPIKFSLGILQLGLGFLVLGLSFYSMGEDGKVPMVFLALGYLLITTGELSLSPIGLSKVTQLAPKHMIGFIVGIWFVSSTYAHFISGELSKMTTKPFYTETNMITVKDSNGYDIQYVFDLDFNFKHNVKNIKRVEKYDDKNNTYILKELKDTEHINLLIIKELLESENEFWWDIKTGDKTKGQLLLTLKSEKSNNDIPKSREEKAEKIKTEWKNKLNEKEDVSSDYWFPSVITICYQTNESLQGNQDAIAGISFISDKANGGWVESLPNGLPLTSSEDFIDSEKVETCRKINLSEGPQYLSLLTEDEIEFKFNYHVKEGPSDILSKYTLKILGSPSVTNKSVAVLLQYNIVFIKVSIVTCLIALFAFIISPFIKKLMHGVH